MQVEILATRGDLAGVVEDRAVHGREDLPPVLRLQQEQVAIAEPEILETAQIVGAAERALEIERDLGPGVGLRRRDERMQRQNPPVAQQRDVLLQVHLDAVEREPAAGAVVEPLIRQRVAAATTRIAARLTRVDVDRRLVLEDLRLRQCARQLRRVEDAQDLADSGLSPDCR